MNLAALLENLRKGEGRGRRAASSTAKSMECVKNLEGNTEEPSGVWRAVWNDSKLRNWGDPPLHGKP